HFAAVFGDVLQFLAQHLAAAGRAAAVRIECVAQRLHRAHVVRAHALVAAFVEHDAGIVAVVDDGVAHDLEALLPAAVLHVRFGVAGRHRFHQAQAVERFHVLLPRRDVHPADQVRIAGQSQPVTVVGEPRGHGTAHRGPFVRRALCVAVDLDHAVVQFDHSVAEGRLPEARAGRDGIERPAVDLQRRHDVVQVAVAPAPEIQARDGRAGLQRDGRAGCNRPGRRPEARDASALLVAQLDLVRDPVRPAVVVAHLRFRRDGGLAVRDVEVARIHVHARRAEARVQGQRLVHGFRHMQAHVLRQAAVVRIKILVVPLVALGRRPFAVVPAVVRADGDDVVACAQDSRNLDTERIDAVLVQRHAP
ncbi:conserved hypothetical protein, partial [Ricinus communis]